jgi:predicted RNA-binding Zn-ribbon protein involved in translation (DUF1610 family)
MRYLSNEEIGFVFQYLKDSLPGKPTAVSGFYSLPKSFDHAFNGPTQQKETALQKISDHMGHFLGLLNPIKVSFIEKKTSGEKTHTVFIVDNEGNIGAKTQSEFVEEEKYAGLYRVRGYDHREILIVNDRTFYLIHFLSVLAHEVTHNYLYQHKITARGKIDSEELTDLATIFLGFGIILLNGYKPSSAISCRLGYIDVSTIRRALIQSYSFRDWNFNDITRQFAWFESHKYYFQFHLLPRVLFRALSSSRSKTVPTQMDNENIIVPCDSCGQKLRIPKRPISTKVTCPKCGSSSIIGNDKHKI